MAAGCNVALVFHGGVVLLLSQVAGLAFADAIRRSTERAAMWRMSHAACSAGAVLLIALGPVIPQLAIARRLAAVLVYAWIGSTYLLCIGTVVAATSGQRGMQSQAPWPNRVVYTLYGLGAVGSTFATIGLLYAAARSL